MIERWGRVFGRENLHIEFFDRIANEPFLLLERLCGFLGVRYEETFFEHTARRNIFKGAAAPMPLEVERHLAKKYLGEVRELADSLGGIARRWCEETESKL
jgi:hypothetical protein